MLSKPRSNRELLDLNRRFYDILWADARLIEPQRFNTWPLVRSFVASRRRLEVAPGLRPRLPIEGTQFVDISTPCLARLRERGASVLLGTVASLPFPADTFDLVCAFDIIEHVDDDDLALHELSRVAAPGAAVLLSAPLHRSRWTAFDELVGHRRRYEPVELLAKLADHGLSVKRIAVYGMRPRSERDIVLWNPALLDPELGIRASALFRLSPDGGTRVARAAHDLLREEPQGGRADPPLHVRSGRHRNGGSARALPRGLHACATARDRAPLDGREFLGVSATDALELGIDIGQLDCAISVGFPGTVASLRQQWGRAGRRSHGLAVLVASDDALDQFFMREPEALLERRVEATRLDHANPRILDPHVYAAAYEGPLSADDTDILGPEALRRAAVLPELESTPAGFVWKGRDTPAARFSLRSGDRDSFTIVDAATGSVLGLAERDRAYSTVHEGAIYLHLGEQYLVRELDGVTRTAVVEPARVDWYTQVQKDTQTAIEQPLRGGRVAGVELQFGRVSVTEQVIAYQRKAIGDGSTLEVVPLILPEVTFETEAVWFCPSAEPPGGARGDAEAPRRASCGRACAHLVAAPVGDVRSLGHRRPLHEHPLPDRAPDRLRLRRPRRGSRHHRTWLRLLRRLGGGHCAPARGLPVHERLPLLRAEPEVRQPERHARQGRRVAAPGADDRRGDVARAVLCLLF